MSHGLSGSCYTWGLATDRRLSTTHPWRGPALYSLQQLLHSVFKTPSRILHTAVVLFALCTLSFIGGILFTLLCLGIPKCCTSKQTTTTGTKGSKDKPLTVTLPTTRDKDENDVDTQPVLAPANKRAEPLGPETNLDRGPAGPAIISLPWPWPVRMAWDLPHLLPLHRLPYLLRHLLQHAPFLLLLLCHLLLHQESSLELLGITYAANPALSYNCMEKSQDDGSSIQIYFTFFFLFISNFDIVIHDSLVSVLRSGLPFS